MVNRRYLRMRGNSLIGILCRLGLRLLGLFSSGCSLRFYLRVVRGYRVLFSLDNSQMNILYILY